MKLAESICEENLKKHVGNTYKVLIESKSFDNKYYVGRSYMDIPELDGLVFVENNKDNLEGEFINYEITDVKGYDLFGKSIAKYKDI